jgi:ABC-type glycerol-3-phosphate transport system permease component
MVMGILQTIAGIIVALYTFSSVVGLWLAYQMMDAHADGGDVPEALSEVPIHHIELMTNYAQGWRRYAWSASIVALFTTLIAMVASSPLAFWALGVAILIDLGLFMTYEDLKGFLAQTDLQERLIDAVQSLALLFAFTLLLWIQMRQGQILQ